MFKTLMVLSLVNNTSVMSRLIESHAMMRYTVYTSGISRLNAAAIYISFSCANIHFAD